MTNPISLKTFSAGFRYITGELRVQIGWFPEDVFLKKKSGQVELPKPYNLKNQVFGKFNSNYGLILS
jgi:hypothetical protein